MKPWVTTITWGNNGLPEAEDGPHIQGVLNLLDNLEEDGGTQLVPGKGGSCMYCLDSHRPRVSTFRLVAVGGFHHIFSKWKSELGDETVTSSGLRLVIMVMMKKKKGVSNVSVTEPSGLTA